MRKRYKVPLNNNNNCYRPFVFNLKLQGDEEKFDKLLYGNLNIDICDEIDSQLCELIALRHPKLKFTKQELAEKLEEYIAGDPKEEIGVWVYYPWLNKIVHLLGEAEFVEVRTNRNQYKITPKEKEILATKTIGIVGLSVGKSIATTIAMERICGHLILADFDLIELSNLNRIQTSVYNLNTKKTVVVAREIAEIDPFIKVNCLHDGITEQNAVDFFISNGRLDICIEVCDGLSAKIFTREKAKDLGIPVVMNSSDRGTTDVERFDLDPNLPILHGLIDHLDLNLVQEAKTNEEKVPYLLPMLGIETSSEKLKASMLEIEESITTWPQLASGVVLGGAICTDVCRRILLNQFTKSGRYFVDLENEINNEVTDPISHPSNLKPTINCIPNTTLTDYSKELQEAQSMTSDPKNTVLLSNVIVKKLVSAAILAPSGGNIQPWKWIYKDSSLFLFLDKNRTASILNYKNKASLLSLGAASENLILEANHLKIKVNISQFPIGHDKNLVASFTFHKSERKNAYPYFELHASIKNRITNRNIGKYIPITPLEENALQSIVSKNCKLKLFTNPDKITAISKILCEVDQLYYTNKAGHKNFINEIRWTKDEAKTTKDGVELNLIDLTPTEKAGFLVAKNWNVTKYINNWKLGKSFGNLTKKGLECASAVGVIYLPKNAATTYFEAGRYLQRVWLKATQQNLSFQPMSIASFLFARLEEVDKSDLTSIKSNLKALQTNLYEVCELDKKDEVMFIFRISKAKKPPKKSLRRLISDVLIINS